jgi:hypothetical protein
VTERCLTGLNGYTYDLDYVELGAEVGANGFGAPPLTVEQVHDACAAEIEPLDPATHRYIEIDYRADGVLRSCVAYPYDCYDDCEFGYRISALTWL